MRRDERILELALERWSQRQIAAEVGLTQGGVSKALRRIFTRQLATLTEETEASRVKLVLLAERRARAVREGHARSQADVTTRRQRKVAAGGGAAATTVVELDTQSAAGNPTYLAVVGKVQDVLIGRRQVPADGQIVRVFEKALPRPALLQPLGKHRPLGEAPLRTARCSIRLNADVSRFTVAAAAPAARRVR